MYLYVAGDEQETVTFKVRPKLHQSEARTIKRYLANCPYGYQGIPARGDTEARME